MAENPEQQNNDKAPEKDKKVKRKLTKYEKWFRFMHRTHHIVKIVYPYKKHGHTQPFNDRAYIFVGNHRSLLDVIPAAVATDKPVHFMAKKELWNKGLMKKFVIKCQCIPVNRDGNDVRAIMTAMKYLKNGESVVIFPEGTRNKTKEVFLPFKSGAAALSIKTKTPIVPVIGLKKIRAFRRHHIMYGEPFELTEYYDKKLTEEDIAEADEKLRLHMLELYNRLNDERTKKRKKAKKGE